MAELASAVGERAWNAVDGAVDVRASIGAARILPGVTGAAVLREADRRMYEDKLRAGQLRR